MKKKQSLIQKADLALSELAANGGTLTAEQAKNFWEIAIKNSELLTMVRKETMTATEKRLPKIGLSQWLMVPSQEFTATPNEDRGKADTSQILLQTKTFKGTVRLSYDQLEENVEQGSMLQLIIGLIGKKAGSEVAEMLLQADPATVGTNARARAMRLLTGVLSQVTANAIDALGQRFGKTLAEQMLRRMPDVFRGRDGLVYITSTIGELDYGNSISNRQTAAGDDAIGKMVGHRFGRIPIKGVMAMPENLGGGFDRSNALLCDPKDIIFGVSKEVQIETAKDVENSAYAVVFRTKFDVKIMHNESFVKATNILASP